ncbi:MAG TPA: TIGR04283 family arsenosugar biosynthesis glycosyltransferase, partial [Nitrospiria bacterium]|nr:TIGR04283 family arsenosugar biosynthesis glycosyltransferase [Nitrospiria bacterium]
MKVSLILPVLDEAPFLTETLSRLSTLDRTEIIVVDGGSRDGSLTIARSYTPLVFTESPGRGRQMNAGASRATGEVLLFLHADSRIDASALSALRKALSGGGHGVVGGAFRLEIESKRFGIRMIAAGANLRSRWLGLAYGDQGIFVRASVFRRLGGFPEILLMEDVSFVRKLRKAGKMIFLANPVVTSPRRWEKEGLFFTTVRNWSLLTLYLMGASPRSLSRWYHP